MNVGTPLLVDTNVTFPSYLKALNKPAKKAYKKAIKEYHELDFNETPFNKTDVEYFMELWSRQTIHGNEPVRWAFDVNYPKDKAEQGVLRVFKTGGVGLHFVEDYGYYTECHPPMYDKIMFPGLATYMWFKLIEFYTQKGGRYLDLGSGDRGTWRDLIEHRKEHPRIQYKWRFISKHVKQHPEKQKHLIIETTEHNKCLQDLGKSLKGFQEQTQY